MGQIFRKSFMNAPICWFLIRDKTVSVISAIGSIYKILSWIDNGNVDVYLLYSNILKFKVC